MSRYQIWDKTSTVYTPAGEALTPEQWIGRYGWMNIPGVVPVVDGGMINGGFSGELGQMVEVYTKMGADFTGCVTPEDKLSVIEAFEDAAPVDDGESSAEDRIAAALEYQNLLSMTVVNEDDPEVIL